MLMSYRGSCELLIVLNSNIHDVTWKVRQMYKGDRDLEKWLNPNGQMTMSWDATTFQHEDGCYSIMDITVAVLGINI